MKKVSVIFTLLTLAVLFASARALPTGYPFVVVSNGNEEVNITDSVFYENAYSVVFPVNKYDLPKDSKFANELLTEVLPAMEKEGMQLESVVMRGAASPEGKHDWNTLLGQRRLETIYNFINENMSAPACEDCVQKIDVAEDYTYLLRMMENAGDADFETVKGIVEKYNYEDVVSIKRELKRINGMRLWKRLLKEYFPELRATRVILVFKKARMVTEQFDANAMVGTAVQNYGDEVYADSLFTDLMAKTTCLRTSNIKTKASKKAAKKEAKASEKAKATVAEIADTTMTKAPRYPMVAVKTNMIYNLLWSPQTKFQPTPNVEVEYYFRNGWLSVLAEYETPWWKNEEKKEFFQIQNWQLEPRYYFKHDHYFNGLFVGAYGMFNRYDFALPGNDGSGVQGEGAGAGISCGYVLPLGKKTSRWKLEFNIKAGYYETHYDPYDYEYSTETQTGKYYYRWYNGVSSFRKRNWRYRWMGPTGVGITISYDLFRRKLK